MALRRDHRARSQPSRGPSFFTGTMWFLKNCPTLPPRTQAPGSEPHRGVSGAPKAVLHPTPSRCHRVLPSVSSPHLLPAAAPNPSACGTGMWRLRPPKAVGWWLAPLAGCRVGAPPGPSRQVPEAAAPAGKSLRPPPCLRLLPPPSGPTPAKGWPPIGRAEDKWLPVLSRKSGCGYRNDSLDRPFKTVCVLRGADGAQPIGVWIVDPFPYDKVLSHDCYCASVRVEEADWKWLFLLQGPTAGPLPPVASCLYLLCPKPSQLLWCKTSPQNPQITLLFIKKNFKHTTKMKGWNPVTMNTCFPIT